MSSNKCVTAILLEKYHDKPWNWSKLFKNPNMAKGLNHFINTKVNDSMWDWRELSRNQNVSLETIEKYIDKAWDWDILSEHDNITLEFVLNHPQKHWNWALLARNLPITSTDLSNPKWNDQLWRPIDLSDNKKLSINFIETYCDDTWSFWSLSNNPKINDMTHVYDFFFYRYVLDFQDLP